MAMLIDSFQYEGAGANAFNTEGASPVSAPAPSVALVGENRPTQQFDLSALAGLRPSDKYLGRNRVSDIEEAYRTYISGSAVGRGGQYAVDAARQYGTTITEAARGYLVAAGLPTLASVLPGAPVSTPDTEPKEEDFLPLPVSPTDEVIKAIQRPIEILADVFQRGFGNAVYNPPLQSQATSYTPYETGGAPVGGGMKVGGFLILGALAIAAYFIYKRVKGA